jgi:endonuclease/exonuclease/phosphatase family metal-dependent hydrolase
MRVVSSNVQHGVPNPIGRPALGRATTALRKLAADVYGFQELDRGRLRTRFQHQGAALADALGGELVWARAKHRLWAAQANALVVRGEVVSHETIRLPGPGERRVAILATVVVRGERWSVATTHLSLVPGAAIRQLQAVLDAMDRLPPPRVVMGDLNLRPERVAPAAAATGWVLLDGPDTINARTGLNRRLDHVLVHGATVTDSGVDQLPVSDHLAVWADLAP